MSRRPKSKQSVNTNAINNTPIEISLLERESYANKINEIINDSKISSEIEKGIYSWSVSQLASKKINKKYHESVYLHKFHNIYANLNEKNERICNSTLLSKILNNSIKPQFVASLLPQQLCPENWETIIQKSVQKNIRENDAIYNVDIDDTYQCEKCGEKKCTSEIIQSDLSLQSNKLVQCTVCRHTMTV